MDVGPAVMSKPRGWHLGAGAAGSTATLQHDMLGSESQTTTDAYRLNTCMPRAAVSQKSEKN